MSYGYTRPIGKKRVDDEVVTVSSTAKALSAAKYANASTALITVEGAQVRMRFGADPILVPTATGHILEAGDTITLDSKELIAAVRFLRTGSTDATLQVTYFDWVM